MCVRGVWAGRYARVTWSSLIPGLPLASGEPCKGEPGNEASGHSTMWANVREGSVGWLLCKSVTVMLRF